MLKVCEKSFDYHQKALLIRIKICSEEYADLPESYEGIGITLKSRGKIQEALEHFQKALLNLEKIYRKDHPQLIALQEYVTQYQNNRGISYEFISQ